MTSNKEVCIKQEFHVINDLIAKPPIRISKRISYSTFHNLKTNT